jgi:hypothetical protein
LDSALERKGTLIQDAMATGNAMGDAVMYAVVPEIKLRGLSDDQDRWEGMRPSSEHLVSAISRIT